MNLHHLELFYYVARHGGISRAVRHMPYGIQQPAMSTQISALEQDLGTKLFERQPFRLTADGQELYDFARPFFDNADAIADRLRKRSAPKIRIASSELILRDHLPHVLDAVRAKQPALRFALSTGSQSEIESRLMAGDLDLAITSIESRPRAGLKCFSIVKLPLVLLVPKASPLKSAKDLWAQDAIEDPLIALAPDEIITRTFRTGLKALRVEWPTSIEASSTELVTRYVANGYGIGVTVDLSSLVRETKVRVIPLPGFEPVEIASIWHPPVDPAHQILHDAIVARARELWPAQSSAV